MCQGKKEWYLNDEIGNSLMASLIVSNVTLKFHQNCINARIELLHYYLDFISMCKTKFAKYKKCQMWTNLIMASPSSGIFAPWLTRTWYRYSSCPQDIVTLSRPQFGSYMPYLVLKKYAIWITEYIRMYKQLDVLD